MGLDAVMISKAFFHIGKCEDKIVFYFDSQLKISRNVGNNQVEYWLHDVQIAKEAQEALEQMNNVSQDYQLQFLNYQNSLKVKINFNPAVVTKIYLSKFTPISKTHGLVIKILRTGSLKASKCLRVSNHKEIVLDFGHGGQDVGAKNGEIYEKEVVKSVGLKLAKILINQGYVVHLTRHDDQFIPLDQRTHFANMHTQAGLFVSLHANHASNSSANGIETYYMHYNLLTGWDEGSKVSRYLLNAASANLATQVHTNILAAVKKYHINDRKVKQSVSQVLLGVEMPAILVELGFISNLQEAQLLDSQDYQQALAAGIAKGINAYHAAQL